MLRPYVMRLYVEWTETTSFSQVIEIDESNWLLAESDYDVQDGLIKEAISELEEEAHATDFDRKINYFEEG